MMFPNRDLSVKRDPQRKRSLQQLKAAFFLLSMLAVTAGAGQFVTSDFTNEDASSNILNPGNSLSIAPRETLNVPIFIDEILSSNTVVSSYYSDVVVSIGDTFCFFWGEDDGAKHDAYRRKILLTLYGYTMLPQQTMYVNSPLQITFIHGVRGTTPDNLVSSFYSNLYVHACTGSDSVKFSSFYNNSIAHIANDTFCIVSKLNNTYLEMHKVRLSGGDIELAGVDTIATNILGAAGNFNNSSVAVDSSGNIFILMTRGGTILTKYVEYLLTNSDFAIIDGPTLVANGVSLNTAGEFLYADAPVVSYADNKFASVYWTSAGVYLYDVSVAGAPPAVTNTTPVVTGDTYRSATVATNGKKLIIAWKNITTQQIEGKILLINNGVLPAIPAQTEVFSDAATTIADDGPELNAVINEMGSIALTWKQNLSSVGSIWAARGVAYSSGWWSSVVESVTVIPEDSIVFQPGDVDTTLNMGTLTCSLQVGPTNTPPAGWTSWLSLSSAADLAQYTIGTGKYFRYKMNFERHGTDSIKTPVVTELTVNWNLKPIINTLDSVKVNSTPVAGLSGFADTIDVISHTDIIDCYFAVHDGDPEDTVFVSVPWYVQPELAKDSLSGSVDRVANVRLMPGTVWDTIYDCSFLGNDSHLWDAVSTNKNLVIRSRKASPVITAVTFDGSLVTDSAQVNIVIGSPATVQVSIERPSVVDWNKITYRFVTNNFDTSITTSSQLTYQTAGDDAFMRIITTDAFSAADTFMLYFFFPQYATDIINNPGYSPATDKLADSLSYILGTVSLDTVLLPIMNTGNDTLDIDSMFFAGSALTWLHLGVPQATGTVFFDSLTGTSGINTFYLFPGTRDTLVFILDLQNLSGDGVLYDTVIIHTNDPLYPVDTVTVMLGYNDLPVITDLAVEFDPGVPYWDSKRTLKRGYLFPPHAKVAFSFSEPMDSASAAGKTFAYSIFDYNTTGRIDTIPFMQVWSGNYTELQLRPNITIPSTYFNGLIPPPRTFIPTDSIVVIILNEMHDQATTPGSPNYLDINNDFVNDIGLDSTTSYRIDSIHFTLDSVIPNVSDTGVSSGDSIVLIFSGPIYPGTVDTSTYNNRTLLVTTRYNSFIDTARQVIFDDAYITGNRAVFKPGKNFFFGDSVYCYYRGVCVRDTLGYSVDMNMNGMPIGFFDSASTEDDYFWSFKIGNIVSDSVIPDSAETDVSLTTPITLIFSVPLLPGTVDTSLVGNRSLKITSRYSEGTQINYDSVVVGTNQATFYFDHRLFYSDSVFCDFGGLVTWDSSNFSVDITGDTIYSNQVGRSWFFLVEDLTLETVSPDSASAKAGIHSNLSMTFSGPISPTVFDTTTDADSNGSFSFTSAYSVGERLPISNIRFSSDSTRVTIDPQKAFYSYDSINCDFVGFVKNYSYINPMSLIPTDTSEVIGSYSWYFTTKSSGFYTYPNPFKPGSKSSHRAQGGIWFKNLHAIKKRGKVTAVRIKVFNMNTHPVFKSPVIHFEENNPEAKPEWKWDTKNNKGSEIASGIYFYAIYDTKGKVLLKGKILIVR